jgi:hypothetical protein
MQTPERRGEEKGTPEALYVASVVTSDAMSRDWVGLLSVSGNTRRLGASGVLRCLSSIRDRWAGTRQLKGASRVPIWATVPAAASRVHSIRSDDGAFVHIDPTYTPGLYSRSFGTLLAPTRISHGTLLAQLIVKI